MVSACAWLYVPAARVAELLDKACRSADGVIIDLEDATHPDDRERARLEIGQTLSTRRDTPIAVRINPAGSLDFEADVELVTRLLEEGVIDGVRLPKVETADDVQSLWRRIEAVAPSPVIGCLIESAQGVTNIDSVARSRGVSAVMLGESDLRADLGLPRKSGSDQGLLYARQRIVVASISAGLGSPSGSVFPNTKDADGLRDSSRALRDLGFWGRSCIHPAQIDVVREAFRPTDEEVQWAQQILAREADLARDLSSAGTLSDGSFIDPAISRQAHDILHRVGTSG